MQELRITQISVPELENLIEESIKRALSGQKHESEHDQWFNLKELCNYLPDKPSPKTVYGWKHKKLIPCNKDLKKLRFSKSEIDNWLKQGRMRTFGEIDYEASNFIKSTKK